MKQLSTIEIFTPGIVVFDPIVVAEFVKHNKIEDTNLFRAFLADERVGRLAINQGVVLPIYEIPEDTYSVYVIQENSQGGSGRAAKFTYSGFPLDIRSGVVVIADLNALFDWDADFFTNYLSHYGKKLASNDYLEVKPGLYDVSILGYSRDSLDGLHLTYGLKFLPVLALPNMAENKAIDDFDFSLY